LKNIVHLVFLSLLVSCGSSEIDKRAKWVNVKKVDPPSTCRKIASIEEFCDYCNNKEAQTKVKLRAVELSANYVKIDSLKETSSSIQVAGVAYQCQEATK